MDATREERLVELLAVTRAIAAATDYDALLDLVAGRTASFLSADRCLLLLADASGVATVAASVGVDRDAARAFASPLDERVGAEVCRMVGCQPQRLLIAPVFERARLRGLLVAHRTGPERADDEFLLSALADQAAIALAHVEHRREIEAALAALEDADRRKNEFLAVLSHELRNPLTPITTALRLVECSAPGSEQAARALAVARRQVAHLGRLVDDLLDVVRVTAGKAQLRIEEVDLKELVARTVDDHRETFAEAGLALDLRLTDGEVRVRGDAARIVQMLGNLLSNAVKFTERGGRVGVSLAAGDPPGFAALTLRDTGIGIDADTLSRVFEPFVQADRSLARSQGGLGLGLALVKALADLQGGEAVAESEGPGRGATMTIRLPLAAARPAGAAPSEGASERARAPHRRVLIVEDNDDAAGTMREWIELSCGCEVAVAHDGPAGLARASEFRPDLVLCDIGLPGMDGYEFARRFRATRESAGCVLVAVTGYALRDDVKRAMAAGFDEHLAKPPDLTKLQALLTGTG